MKVSGWRREEEWVSGFALKVGGYMYNKDEQTCLEDGVKRREGG